MKTELSNRKSHVASSSPEVLGLHNMRQEPVLCACVFVETTPAVDRELISC